MTPRNNRARAYINSYRLCKYVQSLPGSEPGRVLEQKEVGTGSHP